MHKSVSPRYTSVARGKRKLTSTRRLRLSPRDTFGYIWMAFAGAAKLYLSSDEEAAVLLRRAIEINRNYPLARTSGLPQPLPILVDTMRRELRPKMGLPLIRPSRSRASTPARRATIRLFWLSASVSMTACARPGCRRDERPQTTSASSNALASFRSSVSKPSVNQP
jgi:hypothetical protein